MTAQLDLEDAIRAMPAPGFKERGGTSELASARLEPIVSGRRAEVFRIVARYPRGVSAEQVAEDLKWKITSVRPRLSDLFKAGCIEKYETTTNDDGSSVRTWRVRL